MFHCHIKDKKARVTVLVLSVALMVIAACAGEPAKDEDVQSTY